MTELTTTNLQAALGERFVLDREIGRGGAGVVYQARDIRLGRQLAIKVLAPDNARWAGSSAFEREIRYAARLQHPNILPLIETGFVGDLPYYVMPYVKGGSLRDLLNRDARLPVDQAMKIVQEIGAALECAHDNRIVHLDLKPENILLSNGIAVLTDFGIAHLMRKDEFKWRKTGGTGSGTPLYMSPEQATGEAVSERSDVYSMACVIYEMLTGQPPCDGESIQAILAQRLTAELPLISEFRCDVPRAFAHAVDRALAVEPENRFSTIGVFVSHLGECLRSTEQPAVRPVERARRWSVLGALSGLFHRDAGAHMTGEHLLTGEH